MVGATSFWLVTETVIFWYAGLIPSVAVIVALYSSLISKSGAVIKVNSPELSIDKSLPETENCNSLLSTSDAMTVPTLMVFSSIEKYGGEEKVAVTSSILVTKT